MSTPANPTVDKFGRAIPKVDYSPAGPSNAVSFEFGKVQPPSIVYIQRDDVIICQAATSQTAEVVTFNVRILQPDGRVEESQFTLRPSNSRTSVSLTLPVSEGYLISLAASASVATTRGMTFARAYINRSIFGPIAPAQTIFADYITTLVSSGYPNGRVLAPTEGPGNVFLFSSSIPAVANDWTVNMPANTRWKIRSINAELDTSAAVANRLVGVAIQQGGSTVYLANAAGAQAASLFINYSFVPLLPYTENVTNQALIPIPPDLLMSTSSGQASLIRSNTANLQTGDQWHAAALLIEEWLDNV
jgi:hypothetical protein